jgi:predicted metalloprotease with PDZ domain
MTSSASLSWLLAGLLWASYAAAKAPLELEVDARNVRQGIQHVRLIMPVHSGPLILAYPQWIPGEHRPNGSITQLMNLHVLAGSRELMWRRSPQNAFLFQVSVPTGATALEVRFDYFSPPRAFGPGFGNTPDATSHLLILEPSTLVLYPADLPAQAVDIDAKVLIPPGWKVDCALPLQQEGEGAIRLPRVSLSTLVDSPLLAGEYVRSVQLTDGVGGTRISMAADAPEDLAADDPVITAMRRLVGEANVLLGPGHYRSYVWLTALSDRLSHDGLEHHESSDVRAAEGLFVDPARAIDWHVFPHEYVHSWNGKYRRPGGLATLNYQQPANDELLWVYEGLTRYYGDFVLAARSSLASPEQTQDYLAYIAAVMQRERPGRSWRSLADTARTVPEYAGAPAEWTSIRRGADYYAEGLLLWLHADTMIRQTTAGSRSLDDFALDFFSGPERGPAVKPYARADLVRALHAAAPLDWEAFVTAAVDAVNARAPLAGLEASGWTLAYGDTPNSFLAALEKTSGVEDLGFSLGLSVQPDGTVVDVVAGSAAFAAGLAPAMQIIAINGRRWSAGAAHDAILAVQKTSAPLRLVVASSDVVSVLDLNYHGGLQYPQLRRVPGRPDVLGQILAPRVSPRS